MRLSTPSGPFHGRALPFHATRQVDEFSICLNKVPAGLIVWTGPWHLGWLCFSPRHDESMARKTGTVTSESELWTTPMRFHPFHPFPFFLFFFTVYKYVKYVLFSLCFPLFPFFHGCGNSWKFSTAQPPQESGRHGYLTWGANRVAWAAGQLLISVDSLGGLQIPSGYLT